MSNDLFKELDATRQGSASDISPAAHSSKDCDNTAGEITSLKRDIRLHEATLAERITSPFHRINVHKSLARAKSRLAEIT